MIKKREIEDLIWNDDGLSSSEKLVALSICRHYNNVDGRCFPSHERIAEMSGMSRRSVVRAYDGLREKGVIETRKRTSLQCSFSVYVTKWHNYCDKMAQCCEDGESEIFGSVDDTEKAYYNRRK